MEDREAVRVRREMEALFREAVRVRREMEALFRPFA